MKPLVGSLTVLVLLLGSTASAQALGPADPATSIYLSGDEERTLDFFARVVPLEAFNAAVAKGGFLAAEASTANNARHLFGVMSDPKVLGITAQVGQTTPHYLSGDLLFIVARDARFIPGSTTILETSDFFFVTGQFPSLEVPWSSQGFPRVMLRTPVSPAQLPSACCPASTADGFPEGFRCIDWTSGAGTAWTPEAAGLALTGARPYPLHHLRDAVTYATLPVFTDTRTPPASTTPERCVACERRFCSLPADGGTPDGGGSDGGGGCRSDLDCGGGKRCTVTGACVAAVDERPRACLSNPDCPQGQICTLGSCVLKAGTPSCLGAWCQGPGGGACRVPADCPKGVSCRGGVCVPSTCFSPTDCPPKHQCTPEQVCRSVSASPVLDGGSSPVLEIPMSGSSAQQQRAAEAVDRLVSERAEETERRAAAQAREHLGLTPYCPTDAEVTAWHCLDPGFFYSPCGRRFRRPLQGVDIEGWIAEARSIPDGGFSQRDRCEQLILRALATWPKLNPAHLQAPRAPSCVQGAAQGRPSPRKGAVSGPGAPVGATCSLEGEAHELKPDAGEYAAHVSAYGALYQLDGRPLSERDGGYRPFTWVSDEEFDRRDLPEDGGRQVVHGAAGSYATREIRQFAEAPLDPQARARIAEREARWALRPLRNGQLASCQEYAFQRLYELERFKEAASLAGADDWAIYDLAFGDAALPTSLGTHLLPSARNRGVKDSRNGRIQRLEGGELTFQLPGSGQYLKNAFFTPKVEDDFPQAALFAEAELPPHLVRETWTWHKHVGAELKRRGYSLKDFDELTGGDEKALRAARDEYHRARLASISTRFPGEDPERYGCPGPRSSVPGAPVGVTPRTLIEQSLARFFFPSRLGHGDALAERRHTDPYYSVPLAFERCWVTNTGEVVRRARAQLLEVLNRAEAMGYLDLSRPTPADWSPRLFAHNVKGLGTKEREAYFQKCVRYTGDSFRVVESRAADAGVVYTGDFGTLERYFQKRDEDIQRLPAIVRQGTRWESSDSLGTSSHGFGVYLDYRSDLEVGDFVPDTDDIARGIYQVSLAHSAHLAAGVKAFGQDLDILSYDVDLHTKVGGELPIVRVLDVDALLEGLAPSLEPLPDPDRPVVTPLPQVVNFVLDRQEVELGSLEYETRVWVYGIELRLAGGVSGWAGGEADVRFERDPHLGYPRRFSVRVTPVTTVKAFIEGGVSLAAVVSASVRVNLTLVELKFPLEAGLQLNPAPEPDFLMLSGRATGNAELELLAGNLRVKLCAGIWPFRACHKKTVFEWDAAISQGWEFLSVPLPPVSLGTLALAKQQRDIP